MRRDNMQNPYLPMLATIQAVKTETVDTTSFTLQIDNPAERDAFDFKPGQFLEVSIFGAGEAPFCISAGKPGRTLDITVRSVGRVTKALHAMGVGGQIGIRGPLGNSFPLQECYGKHMLFVAGGLGLAPLRPQIYEVYHQREKFASVNVLVGARTQGDLIYRDELDHWQGLKGMTCLLTVDTATEGWTGNVGVVGSLLPQVKHVVENGIAFVCGPPIMIRFVVRDLEQMGFTNAAIYTTLEQHMRCGIGKCNHCMMGDKYVCLDGPVFTYEQLQAVPEFAQ